MNQHSTTQKMRLYCTDAACDLFDRPQLVRYYRESLTGTPIPERMECSECCGPVDDMSRAERRELLERYRGEAA